MITYLMAGYGFYSSMHEDTNNITPENGSTECLLLIVSVSEFSNTHCEVSDENECSNGVPIERLQQTLDVFTQGKHQESWGAHSKPRRSGERTVPIMLCLTVVSRFANLGAQMLDAVNRALEATFILLS